MDSNKVVLSKDQLQCLSSPACSDVFFALRSVGEATAKELSVRLDRTPATVLYHLGRLERAGLARITERRAAVRKPEAVYRPTSDRFDLPADESLRDLKVKTVQSGLRRAIRGWERAAEADAGPMHVIATQARLSESDARELMRMIDAAAEFMRQNQTPDGAVIHWTSTLYPA